MNKVRRRVDVRRAVAALTVVLLSFHSGPGNGGQITEAIRSTLEKGADPNRQFKADVIKIRPLHAVVGDTEDHLEAARLLLDAGADPNGRDELGGTPLHRAASRLNSRFAGLLLKHGADPNARNNAGETPLHELESAANYLGFQNPSETERREIREGLHVTAAVLLKHGGDPNLADDQGRTPLHRLAQVAPAPVVKVLLEHGADTKRRDKRGDTPLKVAVVYNVDPAVVEVLLEHGADPEGVDLLVRAIEDDRPRQAAALVRHGAPVKGSVRTGDTPLYAAVMGALTRGKSRARMDLIRELLARGAPHDSRGALGGTARGLAAGDAEILALFGTVAAEKSGGGKPPPADTPAGVVAQVMEKVNAGIKGQRGLRAGAHRAADLATLASREEIPGRMERLKAYSEALASAIEALNAAAEEAGKLVASRGFDEARINEMANLLADALLEEGEPALSAFYEAEREWVEALLAGYRLLAENPRDWSPKDAGPGKSITLFNEDFARRFGKAVQHIRETAGRAKQARQRLQEALGP